MRDSTKILIAFFIFLFGLAGLDTIAHADEMSEALAHQRAMVAKAELQVKAAELERAKQEAEQEVQKYEKIRKLENELMYTKGRLDGIQWMLKEAKQ